MGGRRQENLPGDFIGPVSGPQERCGKRRVGIFQLEKLLGLSEKHLDFHIWYLKEKGWVERVESGGFAITANGVDQVIEKDILITQDKLLPLDKNEEEKIP